MDILFQSPPSSANPSHYILGACQAGASEEEGRSGAPAAVAAISATELYEVYAPEGSFQWLREREPDDRVGYSIFVYDFLKTKRPNGSGESQRDPSPHPAESSAGE